MNKIVLFFVLVMISHVSLCQTFYPYGDVKLEKPADYKATEPLALSAASFLLSSPFAEADENRASAFHFVVKWMSGAKEYSFYMKGKVADLVLDENLLSIYLAAMLKYSLENRAEAVNPLTVERNASKMVLAYCDDPKNNFKLKKKSRKILETN